MASRGKCINIACSLEKRELTAVRFEPVSEPHRNQIIFTVLVVLLQGESLLTFNVHTLPFTRRTESTGCHLAKRQKVELLFSIRERLENDGVTSSTLQLAPLTVALKWHKREV